MDKKVLMLVLASIVVLSGCTASPAGTGRTNGISITKFSPDYTEIGSGEQVKLTLSIQNAGGSAATGLVAQLFSGVDKNLGWNFISGGDTQSLAPDRLLPADDVNNLPGESLDYSWTLGSPSNLRVTTPYTAAVRVYYHYSTSSVATLRFYSDDYLKSLPAAQSQSLAKSAGISSQKSSIAPLSVSFSTGSRPLIVRGGSGGQLEFQMTFTNVGSGDAIDPDAALPNSDYSSLHKVSYTITTNGLSVACPAEGGGETSGSSVSGKITLSGGKTKTVYCTMDSPGTEVANFRDYSVNVGAAYGYFVEGRTAINVLAAPSSGGVGGTGTGGGGTIMMGDVCSKSCDATGQIYKTGKPAIGMCTDKSLSSVTYPGTTIDVVIDPLSASAIGKLSTILGSNYPKATIKSLSLHDEKVSDLNLQSMTIGLLDTKAASIQYESASLSPKIPNTAGIVDYLCNNAIPDTVVLTQDSRNKGTLCAGYPSSTPPLSGIPLSNIISINGQPGSKFKDSPVSGLAITSIANRNINDITGGKLNAINVEDFKISSISTILSNAPTASDGRFYLQYAKCSGNNAVSAYGPDTLCQCVIGVAGSTYGAYDGAANTACTTACPRTDSHGNKLADGGACNALSAGGTSQCKGTTLVTYHAGATPTNPANSCDPKVCLCYDMRGMSSTEASLVCK